jgi:hypothetical protein
MRPLGFLPDRRTLIAICYGKSDHRLLQLLDCRTGQRRLSVASITGWQSAARRSDG